MSQSKQNALKWSRALVLLSLTVVFLLLLLFSIQFFRSGNNGNGGQSPTDTSGITNPSETDVDGNGSDPVDHTDDTVLTEGIAEPDGSDYHSPITLTAAVLNPISLPDAYQVNGFEILHILPGGELILQNASRISIYNPVNAQETVVATADFGLQAAANDRFIVYGEGGDEVFRVEVYTIANSAQSIILEDTNGYFGFELDEENRFYTTKVEALNYGKAIGDFLIYDLISGDLRAEASDYRSLGSRDLHQLDTSLNLEWLYEDSHPWYEAWRVNAGTTFVLEIEYEDRLRETYRYELFRLEPNGGSGLIPMSQSESGPRPTVSHLADTFVYNGNSFYDSKSERWYRIDLSQFDQPAGAASVLALNTTDDGGLYIAERGERSPWSALYIAETTRNP